MTTKYGFTITNEGLMDDGNIEKPCVNHLYQVSVNTTEVHYVIARNQFEALDSIGAMPIDARVSVSMLPLRIRDYGGVTF